jgi:farnesyl diphosphate synthase
MVDFDSELRSVANEVDALLDSILPQANGPEAKLLEAMRYAALGGGKRLRPFMAIQSGAIFGMDEQIMLRIAAAIECVHTYSLVHDDLPCMDDDAMRHGKPATHKVFGEATAVLVGDGLLTFAFEILSDVSAHPDPFVRCELMARLTAAIGSHGMVGGQMIDMEAEDHELEIAAITRMQRMKTGNLIAYACEAGAVAARASQSAVHALGAYAHDLGIAFQITDDILDIEGDSAALGKTAGKDEKAGKATFVSTLGPERAKAQARLLASQAVAHLDLFDEKADRLRQVADFVVERHR